jgi:SAM-dependent methyltransferase
VTADHDSSVQSSSPRARVAPTAAGKLSCVIDSHPRFHLDALRWFAALTRLAGVEPADLVVHAVGPARTDALTYLAARGAIVREIQPFDPRSPHCNKIAGALRLAAERPDGLVVLTDSDLAICEDPRRLEGPSDQVRMTPVHMANPPLEVLANVFGAAGLPLPRRAAIQLQPGELTVAGNGNGGLYLVPGGLLADVARAWAHWARWLLERAELLAAWSHYVDQVAMALALAAESIPACDLDVRWNFPIHVPAIIPADPPMPAVIHYHQQLDPAGRILPTGVAAVDRRIADANAALGEIWSEAFPNATFWEWRYLTNPDLGSGVGSRGKPLEGKRALLAALIEVLRPASTLDVGCGDGEATKGIAIEGYVGLDLSAAAIERARTGRSDGVYRIGTLAEHPLEADLTICLDVLIHQSDPAVYHDLVSRLLRSSTRALVVSGYEHPIGPTFSTVHYHEPLTATLRRLDPAAEIHPLREEHQITTVLVLKAPTSRPGRGARPELIPGLVKLLAERASLLGELEAQREALSAELRRRLGDNERLAGENQRQAGENQRLADENHAYQEARDRLAAELDRWRKRVSAMESTRAWRLRAWLLRMRRGGRE